MRLLALIALHPDVVSCSQRATRIARIYNAARFNNQGMAFPRSSCNVLNALWHNKHLPSTDGDRAITKPDFHLAFQHDKDLVSIFMVVPHELAPKLHELELVVVHLSDDARRPVLGELRELLTEIDWSHFQFYPRLYP